MESEESCTTKRENLSGRRRNLNKKGHVGCVYMISLMHKGQRQMIIERATLRHQLEAAEEREVLLRNNLGDHQDWLNNCYENMGRARRQVHYLAEQTSYVIKNHRRMNDLEVAEQARAIVPHLPKVLLNLYETLRGQKKPKEDDED
ncbi:hypothetical protein KY285_013219 [Solanum tuberosum]|nr:hypothetical protein KY285_013219 [Solanum tuberosum]